MGNSEHDVTIGYHDKNCDNYYYINRKFVFTFIWSDQCITQNIPFAEEWLQSYENCIKMAGRKREQEKVTTRKYTIKEIEWNDKWRAFLQ